MSKKLFEGEKKFFVTGNEVIAWAALAANVDIMYGYPITPQNEIMHYWTRICPQYDKKFLQTEDEISAGFATIGGVLAGARAFTATSGPGNVLMQEPLAMAEMMRIPTVVVVQQRGGPSTATVIYSQQEVNLTCFGGNGEGMRIVYSTSSHQELFDYTIKAFNTAWKYRFPTFVLGDGYQAKMRESVTMYDPSHRGIEMVSTEQILGSPGSPGVDRDPSQLRNTFNTEEELFEIISKTVEEFNKIAPEIVEHEEFDCEDADLIIVSHGVVSRAARGAVNELRKKGKKIGYFRPITLRPFPKCALEKATEKAKRLFVVESAQGQLEKIVKSELYEKNVPIDSYLRPGLGITTEELVEYISNNF
ncbi:2-oxoglutarate ferredoxin oxidoreductase, alpha subunit [Desulfonispora thiosulfatigenes DSM 11270]|uniref:2-oxoglutarate ferredoxin oxidoreductase, alpha subunit n=1 Tax=Desulfonispora thiosulfatigenes DSM 11270 TaxID=656914 RepID=A0A1W1V130_DESTI|nr:ferredoxin oxidoreductase [Desulfonispora thiosulfatigenes]SMB87020.1 2-oxoglutarate ferredoxin oxidoreductase, alpha subunit [Desulfonispora thiosulfatigenes DSM 11270]